MEWRRSPGTERQKTTADELYQPAIKAILQRLRAASRPWRVRRMECGAESAYYNPQIDFIIRNAGNPSSARAFIIPGGTRPASGR
jgi:hypothetical protein